MQSFAINSTQNFNPLTSAAEIAARNAVINKPSSIAQVGQVATAAIIKVNAEQVLIAKNEQALNNQALSYSATSGLGEIAQLKIDVGNASELLKKSINSGSGIGNISTVATIKKNNNFVYIVAAFIIYLICK
jgi:hypothetical protein